MAEAGANPTPGPSPKHQGGEYGSIASRRVGEKRRSLMLSVGI